MPRHATPRHFAADFADRTVSSQTLWNARAPPPCARTHARAQLCLARLPALAWCLTPHTFKQQFHSTPTMAAPLQQTSSNDSEGKVYIDLRTGARYDNAALEYKLTEWEKQYQSEHGDFMDLDKVTNWNEFQWQHYNQDRNDDTNHMIFDYIQPLIDRAIERNSMRELHAFIRAFCWKADDIPLGGAGDIQQACVQYKSEAEEFGRPKATARFIVKMVQGHARSVAAGVNYYNRTVENWIVDGMKKLFGWNGGDAYHWDALPGGDHRMQEIWLVETEDEKKEIINSISRKYVGDQQRRVLRGLRQFRLALAEDLMHHGKPNGHFAERAAHVTQAVQAAASTATPAEMDILVKYRTSCQADAAAAAAAAAAQKA